MFNSTSGILSNSSTPEVPKRLGFRLLGASEETVAGFFQEISIIFKVGPFGHVDFVVDYGVADVLLLNGKLSPRVIFQKKYGVTQKKVLGLFHVIS